MYTSFDAKTDIFSAHLKDNRDDWPTSWNEEKLGFFVSKEDGEVVGVKVERFWEEYCNGLMHWRSIGEEVKWWKEHNIPEPITRHIIELVSARLQIAKAEERGLNV